MLLRRIPPQGVSISLTFLALSVSSALAFQSSTPTLYCVSNPANTFVTTLDASLPQAQCFRVENGVFTEVLTKIPEFEKDKITFLDGYVLPGIIESHGHILQYGEMLESVSLYDAKSMTEVRTRIKEFLKKHEGEGYGTRDKWVRGIGWDQGYFDGVMPTAVSSGAIISFKSPRRVIVTDNIIGRASSRPSTLRSLHHARPRRCTLRPHLPKSP